MVTYFSDFYHLNFNSLVSNKDHLTLTSLGIDYVDKIYISLDGYFYFGGDSFIRFAKYFKGFKSLHKLQIEYKKNKKLINKLKLWKIKTKKKLTIQDQKSLRFLIKNLKIKNAILLSKINKKTKIKHLKITDLMRVCFFFKDLLHFSVLLLAFIHSKLEILYGDNENYLEDLKKLDDANVAISDLTYEGYVKEFLLNFTIVHYWFGLIKGGFISDDYKKLLRSYELIGMLIHICEYALAKFVGITPHMWHKVPQSLAKVATEKDYFSLIGLEDLR